jgi:hypothetical protein
MDKQRDVIIIKFALTERIGNIFSCVGKAYSNIEICLISVELMDVGMNHCLKIDHRMCPE